MNKVAHTPGPWKYEADKGYVLKGYIMTADFDEESGIGSVIARTSDNIPEADMALLASAPALLAALTKCLALNDRGGVGKAEFDAWEREARAAIARAEGGAGE